MFNMDQISVAPHWYSSRVKADVSVVFARYFLYGTLITSFKTTNPKTKTCFMKADLVFVFRCRFFHSLARPFVLAFSSVPPPPSQSVMLTLLRSLFSSHFALIVCSSRMSDVPSVFFNIFTAACDSFCFSSHNCWAADTQVVSSSHSPTPQPLRPPPPPELKL